MLGIIDPVTLAAVGVGLMTATGFLLVAAAVEGPSSRRFVRRLQAVRSQRPGAASGETKTRSLSRRDNATLTDRLAQRWLPRRDMLVARLERTGRAISIGRYLVITLVMIGVFAVAAMLAGGQHLLPSVLIGAGLGTLLPHYLIGRMGRRRVAAFIGLFPEAIDLMVRALRSGLPISEATIMAGHEIGDPIGTEFRTIEAGMRLGRDLESLLWDIGKRIDAPEFRFFIIALSVQRETGGNLAETLGNLADVLRRRRQMRAKVRAMSSETRATTMILAGMPVLVIVMLVLTSPHYLEPLYRDVRGFLLD